MRQEKNSDKVLFRCWINDEEEILSFTYVKGYNVKEFNTRDELLQYCYKITYKGYRVQ